VTGAKKPKLNDKQVLENFRQSIKSEVTRDSAVDYLHAFMRQQNMQKKDGSYSYTSLLKGRPEDIQNSIVQFVIAKKKEGIGASGLDNYINNLQKFYKTNGIRTIDWELVRSYKPETVKKSKDREYLDDEVIAIERRLNERGKVISGLMRGSGVRRGAEPTVNIGDLFPMETKYGKIYKMWVYRSSKEEYPTVCTPEVAERIDAYLDYRLRFGEVCPQYGRDHVHEYYDGEESIQRSFKYDEKHLDPEAPLIREEFDRKEMMTAKNPRRITYNQISDIIREAAIASGVRIPNKGQPYKRHKVMITHGFRKLFKKRCRKAKMDAILLERFLGHTRGNPKDGVNKLMMIYDPEDWNEMEQAFINVIPELTINKSAKLQAELEHTRNELEKRAGIEKKVEDFEKERKKDRETINVLKKAFEQTTGKKLESWEGVKIIGMVKPYRPEKTIMKQDVSNQKVVLLAELSKWIDEGWEYVRDLPPDKALIRRPLNH